MPRIMEEERDNDGPTLKNIRWQKRATLKKGMPNHDSAYCAIPTLPVIRVHSRSPHWQKDEFLSCPGFLPIFELGPRSFIYHAGAFYSVNGVILPVGNDDVLTQKVNAYSSSGYLHPTNAIPASVFV
jgi:hypothetical protein